VVSDLFAFWQRGMMMPFEVLRPGDRRRGSVPFPEQQCQAPDAAPAQQLEDVYARNYVTVLQRLNDITAAQSKVGHALATLWLTADPRPGKDGAGRRQQALHDLLNGYETLSRDYLELYVELLETFFRPAG
jgi:hypothetical protein